MRPFCLVESRQIRHWSRPCAWPSAISSGRSYSLDHAEANFGPAVVQDPLQMLYQHVGEFLEVSEPLPPQLVHPFLQVVEHRAFVAIVPELLQGLFENVSLEHTPVQLEQPVQI